MQGPYSDIVYVTRVQEQKEYRVKIIVSLEKSGQFFNQNEIFLTGSFPSIEEAEAAIRLDMRERMSKSLYFRSQLPGYDLVFYGDVGTRNTYVAYRVVPTRSLSERIRSWVIPEI